MTAQQECYLCHSRYPKGGLRDFNKHLLWCVDAEGCLRRMRYFRKSRA